MTLQMQVDAAGHAETHAAGGVCWLCSDQVPWWREARLRAGYSEEPPFERPKRKHRARPPRFYDGPRRGHVQEFPCVGVEELADARDDNRALEMDACRG